ncbi:hypothetical protein FYJ44_12140 [Desulfovibrio sp. PG-178-WT-4]|uniref:Uncharacterized protein n=1 Tax=Desulfovibrio porci TaxID=2605782 RepID=A0A6L5XN93_9BACT|nr:hypothetical protein [Desulfovibrio porci]MDY3810433.1 hypothetical protein [Desulfovibrio porci]MSS28764.1 hypothetical protein [Desulfovibrio porci]
MQNLAEVFDDESAVSEALENFAALLDDADFTAELELMGIGRMQFMRRRQMLVEWRGLYMALWRLALASSFPQDAERMFATFLRSYHAAHPDKLGSRIMERAQEYWGMLQPKGDADFSDVARHLGSFSVQDEKQARSLTLRLVLHIRRAYKIIFDRLI